jgi:polar amino acid transport system substrate-binding protein
MPKILARLVLVVVVAVSLHTALGPRPADAQSTIKYFILAGTMEPLMIMAPDDPMAGGMFTEIVKKVFEGSAYTVEPMVMPWQRMTTELKRRQDWIMHGIPAFFEPDIPYRLSQVPVFPFNHIAISRRDSAVEIEKVEDLFGRTVILVENYHYPGLDAHLDRPMVGEGSGKIEAVRAFKPDGTLKMLKHRRGDVVIGFQPRLLYHLEASGLDADEVTFQDVSAIVPTQHMHVAYSPGLAPEFSSFLDTRLAEMQADGTLTQIKEKYYGALGIPE